MKKLNNKGFSLVELIIVIAIMAILAAALAPQLMKYIEKSRVSTDKSTCDSIKSCVNTALTDETIYKQISDLKTNCTFTITSGTAPTAGTISATQMSTELVNELKTTLGDWPKTKSSGATSFVIKIAVDGSGNIGTVSVDTNNGVMSK